jgi:amino acid transporter
MNLKSSLLSSTASLSELNWRANQHSTDSVDSVDSVDSTDASSYHGIQRRLIGGTLNFNASFDLHHDDGHDDHGLGTFLGVFVPCICTIFGVVIFLRMGVLVGMAGLTQTVLIISFSFSIAMLTVLSLCALMTNGKEVGGSIYTAIRNSIGPGLGSAVGLVLYAVYTISIAFFILGFAETTRGTFSAFKADDPGAAQVLPWNAPGSWITVCLASAALLLMQPIVLKGADFSAKSLLFILGIILCALIMALICLMADTADTGSGDTKFSAATFKSNLEPDYVPFGRHSRNSFWVMFNVFFPGKCTTAVVRVLQQW